VSSFLTAEQVKQGATAHDTRRLRLFSGTSNPGLAQEIGAYLGVPDGPRVIKRFADGELYIQIQESIRGCDVFLIQPTCAPVNDHLMELLIMVDACRRASARQITAVIPYYGYARADRKTAGRESITAKLVANLLVTSGVDRVLAMDLHSSQIQGYFDIPCDHIYGSPVLVDYLSARDLGEVVVVSPDVGGVARARAFAKRMHDAPLAIIDKRRSGHNVAESLTVIGDVAGKTAILIDDMIDTGGTIAQGASCCGTGATGCWPAPPTPCFHRRPFSVSPNRACSKKCWSPTASRLPPSAASPSSRSCRWPRCWVKRSGASMRRAR